MLKKETFTCVLRKDGRGPDRNKSILNSEICYNSKDSRLKRSMRFPIVLQLVEIRHLAMKHSGMPKKIFGRDMEEGTR